MLSRRLVAEALGTGILAAAVVGSGIMAASLTDDGALALLANSLATGAALVVIITLLAPLSGAHFNPAVSVALLAQGQISARDCVLYIVAQVAGAVLGVVTANLMFDLPPIEFATTQRSGAGLWFAEALATAGLVMLVIVGSRTARTSLPWLIGLYIVAAYWFTSSTSFANPALTIARSLSDSFAGISIVDVPAFVLAHATGAIAGAALSRWLIVALPQTTSKTS